MEKVKTKGQVVAYIRVSSEEQNTERQLADLDADRTFTEKVSGKDRSRTQLKECLTYLRAGDQLHVHSIDRLARNLIDLQQIVDELITKQVSLKFHKEGLLFDGSNCPFQRLQLQIIGAVAEFERAIIRERQREGIQAAKRAGRHLGAPSALNADQVENIRHRRGESPTALAKEFDVSRTTIYKVLASNYSCSPAKRKTATA